MIDDGACGARLTRGRSTILLALLAMTACSGKVVGAQTVAIVNGDEITLSDLNQELANVPPNQRARETPEVIRALVSRKLLAQDAHKRGIDTSPEFVQQERRTRELMLAQRTVQANAGIQRQVVSEPEIRAYIASHPDIAEQRRILLVDQLQFKAPATESQLAALKPARSLEQLATILRSQRIAVKPARAQLDTAMLNDEVLRSISALQPGEPLIAISGSDGVASAIVDTRPAPMAPAEARVVAKKRIENGQLRDRLTQYEATLRNSAKIVYGNKFTPKK